MGDAMVFISVLRVVAYWFPPMRNPLLVQLTGLLGQLGALVAAIPLARALAQFGWTPTFAVSASVGRRCSACWCVLLVRDVAARRAGRPRRPRTSARVGRDLRHAWRDPGTRLGLWSHFTAQFSANVMGLLWGYPFFVHGEHTGRDRGRRAAVAAGRSRRWSADRCRRLHRAAPLAPLDDRAGIVAGDGDDWTVVLLWPGDAPLWLLGAAGRGHRARRAGVDDRLRRRAHLRPAVAARLGHRDRQRRRVRRLAAGRAWHRPGARRGDPGPSGRTTHRTPTRWRCVCSTPSGSSAAPRCCATAGGPAPTSRRASRTPPRHARLLTAPCAPRSCRAGARAVLSRRLRGSGPAREGRRGELSSPFDCRSPTSSG